MAPDVALIFALPTARADPIPELLIDTSVGSLEAHVTDEVKFSVLPSLNCPTALNC